MKTVAFIGCCALALGFVACGSDSDDPTPDPEVGKSYEQAITAAAGGTLATDSGSAALDVPAGALAADTTLTVAVAAKESGTATSVFDFGPTGTQFQTPVTLKLKYDGDPGTDKKAVLATYTDGAWVEVPGSSLAGGVVSGEISHFSKFSVIIVDGQTVVVSGCEDVATNFSPCGGDIVGTWKFQDLCFETFPISSTPWQDSCPEATMEYDSVWDATVTISASTVDISWVSQTTTMAFIAPISCLPSADSCAEISSDTMTCAIDGTNCKCGEEHVVSDIGNQSMPYTIDGTNLVVDGTSQPFCVQGNKLIVEAQMPTSDGTLTYYQVLVKQ